MVGVGRLILLVTGFFPAPDAVPNPDYTYNIGFCTSVIETNLAIITASAPALKPLFRSWFPRLFSSHSAGNPYSSGPYARGNSRYGKSSRRDTATAGLRSGHGGFVMKDMKGKIEIKSQNRNDSDEEIMTFNGIMKTTDVQVRYLDPKECNESTKDSDYGMRTSVDSTV